MSGASFSELRTIPEQEEEDVGQDRLDGLRAHPFGFSRGSDGRALDRRDVDGREQPQAQAHGRSLNRFIDRSGIVDLPIDPSLITPERRQQQQQQEQEQQRQQRQEQGRAGGNGSGPQDGISRPVIGSKRSYADRLSITPAPNTHHSSSHIASNDHLGVSNGHGYIRSNEDEETDEEGDEDLYEDDGQSDEEGEGVGGTRRGEETRAGTGRGPGSGSASGSGSDLTPTAAGGADGTGGVGGSSGSGSGVGRKRPREGLTCDNCRKRKIKCREDTDPNADPLDKSCDGCRKLGIECTYDYVRKKPGRKNGFVIKMRAAQEAALNGRPLQPDGASFSSMGSVNPLATTIDSTFTSAPTASTNVNTNVNSNLPMQPPPLTDAPAARKAKPRKSKSNGYPSFPVPLVPPLPANPFDPGSSTSHVAQPPRPMSSFSFSPKNNALTDANAFTSGNGNGNNSTSTGLEWLDSMLEGTAMGSLGGTGNILEGFNWDQANLLAYESPEHALASGASSSTPFGSSSFGPPSFSSVGTMSSGFGGGNAMGGLGQLQLSAATNAVIKSEPQLEDVTSWANISHFISLFLQYLYPLLPLVHRPTFAEHLATRRDLRDTDFRALLLSIVAYVISQLPTSRLVNDQFDIEGLKRLQRRCHRTCKALQRTYYGPTNLTQISTIIFDMFYLLSIGLGHTAGARLGQAVQLAFSMGMNSDERTAALGLDAIEIQLRRRVFWQLYASDKTRAIPGPPMLINDFQGVCSLPSPIDDEFITSQGMFPQPTSRTSVLSGFVIVSQLFRILSECFFHHRCVATGFKGIGITWTIEAEERLHRVLKEMPLAIQDPEGHGGGGGDGLGGGGLGNGMGNGMGNGLNGASGNGMGDGLGRATAGAKGVFAMQRANVLITAAIAKFALSDLRAALHIKTDQLAKEREAVAREVHLLLMNIPVEDLASNGESMRGKVFHIACALCAQIGGGVDERGQELIKDWCNMFSAITFVQMPLPPPEENLDSRSNSPPHVSGRS